MNLNETRRKMVVVTVGILVVFSVAVPSIVSAAGESELVVTPATNTVTAGQTTTVDVVVDRASGGVGAAEMRVAVDDPDVVSITDVTVRGEPGLTNVTSADDGSWIDVAYATANTDDSGSVTVLTVTVEGEKEGTTGLSILPRADNDAVVAYDETGDGYDLLSVGETTITVRDTGDDGDSDDTGADGDSAESTEEPTRSTATTTPTPPSTQTTADERESESPSTATQSTTSTDGTATVAGDEVTQTSAPGFGVVLTVVALAVTLLLGRRM